MNFPTDEQRIINSLSKGFSIPISIYDYKAVKNVLNGTFLIDNEPQKIITGYTLEFKEVLTAKLDPRFDLNNYLNN
jgi:hypothetical protein